MSVTNSSFHFARRTTNANAVLAAGKMAWKTSLRLVVSAHPNAPANRDSQLRRADYNQTGRQFRKETRAAAKLRHPETTNPIRFARSDAAWLCTRRYLSDSNWAPARARVVAPEIHPSLPA